MAKTNKAQFCDPEVTQTKFENEFGAFQASLEDYRKRGVILLNQQELTVELLFAVPQLNPPCIAFAVRLDYSNWDIEPPSIEFIDPFSGGQIPREKVPINFFQRPQNIPLNQQVVGGLDLLQGGGEISPFFCIPGVREYHDHPAHSGDSWLTHRQNGEGKLITLIEQLYRHSIAQVTYFNVNLNIQVNGINTIAK